MELRHSFAVDASEFDGDGLFEGVPLRASKYQVLSDMAIIRADQDWREHVGPLPTVYRGSLHRRYNATAATVPECLPDRIEVVAYMIELGYLFDDRAEQSGTAESAGLVSELKNTLQVLTGSSRTSSDLGPPGFGRLLMQVLKEMYDIDADRALFLFRVYSRFAENGAGAGKGDFTDLTTLLKFRIEDIGLWLWMGLVSYANAIPIGEDDIQGVYELTRPAWESFILVNDLFSWEKEYWASVRNGETKVANAVFAIMLEHGVDQAEAKNICRAKIRETFDRYLLNVQQARTDGHHSKPVLLYMEALVYSISGNVMWHHGSPRYDISAQYTPLQVEWMTNGIPADLLAAERERAAPNKSLVNGVNGVKEMAQDEGSDGSDAMLALLNKNPRPLGTQVINGPSHYIASLPGKGIRGKVIDALNRWYRVPEPTVAIIKSVINLLHNASLMLDDIQDGSPLRRGKPATHTIFGQAQTINSSSYKICEAIEETLRLNSLDCVRIVAEDSRNLYISQSLDLHWTNNLICPSVEEYFKVLDDKTGGLIRMLTRLLDVNSPVANKPDMHSLTTVLGRLYALRDDYQNLASAEYTQTKGFCEDLDEGKFSLPLIHALQYLPQDKSLILRNILTQRRVCGTSTPEHKQMVLGLLKEAGSLEYTLRAVRTLQTEVDRELEAVEREWGVKNAELRGVIELVRL